jgi:hypothetical protein
VGAARVSVEIRERVLEDAIEAFGKRTASG